jgi:hypothetical protein
MNPGNWLSLACTFEALKMAGYPDGQTKMTGAPLHRCTLWFAHRQPP